MTEQRQRPTVVNVLPVIDENYPKILLSVQQSFDLQKDDAEKLYRHIWIYTHGIAVLCATNLCVFTSGEISGMMSEVFMSLLKEIKGETVQ